MEPRLACSTAAVSDSAGETHGTVTRLRADPQIGTSDSDFDFATGAAGSGMSQITQRVLVPGLAQGAGVGGFNGVAREAGEYLASRGIRILGQDVAVAQTRTSERDMYLLN